MLAALERLDHGQLRAWDAAIRADAAATSGRYAEAEELARRGFELAVGVAEPVSAFGAMTPLVRALVATGRTAEARAVLTVGLAFLDTHPGLGTETSAGFTQGIVAAPGEPRVAEAAAAAAMTFAQEIMDVLGYDDHVVAIVHETAARRGHVFDNRAVYLLKIVDARWTSLRTMDMDHESINRFWDAVGMPAVEEAAI